MKTMRIIPAIDVLGGRLARLSRGDPETAKYYEAFGGPVQAAKRWEREGARFLHVVDLDAAMDRGNNRAVIRQVVSQVSIPVQVGGGLRRKRDVIEVIGLGASRALVGTLAFEHSEEFGQLLHEVGNERLVVALDHLQGRVVIQGWKKQTDSRLMESIMGLIESGARIFLITSVVRDGLMTGPDLESLSRCAQIPGAKIIAAGGIASLEDLRKLKAIGIEEAVIGRALYEGRFNLKDALDEFPG